MGACGMNDTDIRTRTGWYDRVVESSVQGVGHPRDEGRRGVLAEPLHGHLPAHPGRRGSWATSPTGAGSDPGRIGERVIVDPSVRDASLPLHAQLVQYLGSERDGGYADHVAAPEVNAHHIDSPLSDAEQWATFPCSYDTAGRKDAAARGARRWRDHRHHRCRRGVSARRSSSSRACVAHASSRSPVPPRRSDSAPSGPTSPRRS